MNRKRNIVFATNLDYILMILLMFFITLVLFLFVFQRSMSYVMETGLRRNVFYASLVNDSMSSIEAISFNEEVSEENYLSISNIVYTNFGIDIRRPTTILAREMAFLKDTGAYDGYERASSDDKNNKANKDNLQEGNGEEFQLEEEDLIEKKQKEIVDVSGVFNEALVKPMSTEPQVLIYHSHTSESYKPAGARSENVEEGVCAVGEELKAQLEEYGIKTIHDTTFHDNINYNNSYTYSRKTLNSYMDQYGDFKLVIDLHRDAVKDKNSITVNMNGENCAKFMFVMAKANPHFDTNMLNVNGLNELSNELFPGLSKRVYYFNRGNGYFNQDVSCNALLMEVGSYVNTLDEAENTTKYIARVIAEYFNNQTE